MKKYNTQYSKECKKKPPTTPLKRKPTDTKKNKPKSNNKNHLKANKKIIED